MSAYLKKKKKCFIKAQMWMHFGTYQYSISFIYRFLDLFTLNLVQYYIMGFKSEKKKETLKYFQYDITKFVLMNCNSIFPFLFFWRTAYWVKKKSSNCKIIIWLTPAPHLPFSQRFFSVQPMFKVEFHNFLCFL